MRVASSFYLLKGGVTARVRWNVEAFMMKYKYRLPDKFVAKASGMEEFANGATQVTVRLKDGREIPKVLLSDATYLIAARGFKDLPFLVTEIDDIYQTEEDKNPHQRGGWDYWDEWK
jgi:hypothetical protein